MQSDDFLSQVTGTEAKAEQMVVDAETAKRTKLEEKSFALKQEREKKYAEVRAKGNEKIAQKQSAVQKEYEDHSKKGQAEVSGFKTEAEGKIDSVVPDAQQFLLNTLL